MGGALGACLGAGFEETFIVLAEDAGFGRVGEWDDGFGVAWCALVASVFFTALIAVVRAGFAFFNLALRILLHRSVGILHCKRPVLALLALIGVRALTVVLARDASFFSLGIGKFAGVAIAAIALQVAQKTKIIVTFFTLDTIRAFLATSSA